jgi:hypothetical protein
MLSIEIHVKGRIDEDWSEWFQGLSIEYNEAGETILLGEVLDQSELYGLIAKLRDLGLALISVKHSEEGEQEG